MEIIKAFIDLIITIVKEVAKILPFTSKFGIVKYVCEQGIIFGIPLIDNLLFALANLLAISIIFIITSKVDIGGKAKTALSILTYIAILSLFAEKIFWLILLCIAGMLLFSCVILFTIKIIKKEKG